MGLRHDWKFEYTAAEVAKAAQDKHKHHIARLQYWTQKQEDVMVSIKSEGLEIKESVAGHNYTSNAAYGAQIVIDSSLQRDLNECHQKITEHREKAAEYTAYIGALEANASASIPLDVDDIQYFFGN